MKHPTEFIKLKSNTESTQHVPLVSRNWIFEIEKKWTKNTWEIYANEHYDISHVIYDDVYLKGKYWEKNQTHTDFLNELTKE